MSQETLVAAAMPTMEVTEPKAKIATGAMAVFALGFAAIFMGWVAGVASLLMVRYARKEIKESDGTYRGNDLIHWGTVMSLFGIAYSVILGTLVITNGLVFG